MIRVRPARSEDVPRLIEIARHSITAGHWKQEAYARLFETEAAQSSLSLVVEENQCVMGFLVGRELPGGEWEIENVAINGTARRRGLGSRLLGEFLDLVRGRGGTDVYLEVRESNQAARKLYEKWAFIEAGRRKAYYQNPLEDALILRISFPHQN